MLCEKSQALESWKPGSLTHASIANLLMQTSGTMARIYKLVVEVHARYAERMEQDGGREEQAEAEKAREAERKARKLEARKERRASRKLSEAAERAGLEPEPQQGSVSAPSASRNHALIFVKLCTTSQLLQGCHCAVTRISQGSCSQLGLHARSHEALASESQASGEAFTAMQSLLFQLLVWHSTQRLSGWVSAGQPSKDESRFESRLKVFPHAPPGQLFQTRDDRDQAAHDRIVELISNVCATARRREPIQKVTVMRTCLD